MPDQEIVQSSANWEVQKRTLPAEKIAMIDQIAQNLALRDQSKGWLARLVPDKLEKLRRLSDVSILGHEIKVREEIFEMLCDARKQAAREVYNEILVRGKAELRGATALLFAERLAKTSEGLNNIALEFTKSLSRMVADTKREKDAGLKSALLRRFDKTRDRFFDAVEKVEMQFEKILDELRSSPTK